MSPQTKEEAKNQDHHQKSRELQVSFLTTPMLNKVDGREYTVALKLDDYSYNLSEVLTSEKHDFYYIQFLKLRSFKFECL